MFHQYVQSVISVFLTNSIMTQDSSLCQHQKAWLITTSSANNQSNYSRMLFKTTYL